MLTYTIVRGDTLLALAQRYGCTIEALMNANPAVIPEQLQIGQIIQIPVDNAEFSPFPAWNAAGVAASPLCKEFLERDTELKNSSQAMRVFLSQPGNAVRVFLNKPLSLTIGAVRPTGMASPNVIPLSLTRGAVGPTGMASPNTPWDTTLSRRVPSWCEPLRDMINAAAQQANVPADLIAAVIYQKSGGNIKVNATGNRNRGSDSGLMQVNQYTERELEQKYPNRFYGIGGSARNIMLGASYLREIYDTIGVHDWDITLGAYKLEPYCFHKYDLLLRAGSIVDRKYVDEVFRCWSDISRGNDRSTDYGKKKGYSVMFEPVKMASNDLSLSKSVDKLIEPLNKLINDYYISNLLHSQLSVYNKLEYFKIVHPIDSAIFKTILSVFNILPGDFHSDAIDLIKEYHISFTKNMKIFIDNVRTNKIDNLTKLIIEKIEEGKAKPLKSIENAMATELTNPQYILTISTIMKYILNATSQSLMNYMFIFMLHNETTDRTINQLILSDVITAEKSRMSRQAEYFNKTKWILKKNPYLLSWYNKLESALTWYFVFSIIKPILPSSHPIHYYSYNLAQAFRRFSYPQTIKTDPLPDFLEKKIQIEELLDKINNHETNRLLYIITEFTNQTREIENFGDISFTFEFSASAAVLIAQNRLTELFDLYKTSTGTFGSGMTSSVSSLMENSFRDAMKLIKPDDEVTKSFFYLTRADLRSKIDDWNGVGDDLKCLIDLNVDSSCYCEELKGKNKQAISNRASILNKQQRIEYLLIRSFLCTSLGEFQDAFTALLDANYMVNIMKSVSSKHDSATGKKEAPEDDKLLSEIHSFTNEYLQEHLRFSINQSSQQLTDLSYSECLGDYFQNLNILIGTFSIKYNNDLRNFVINRYSAGLSSARKHKYFGELNETEFSSILKSLENFLEILTECTKQAPFILDEKVRSDFIQNIIKFDKYYQIKEQPNPFVNQYYQILKLNTHIRSLSNIPDQRTTVSQQSPNESETNIPKLSSSKKRSSSSDEADEYLSFTDDSPPTTPLDTATSEYYNILSLDGGGIRGIFQAIILMEIERRTGRTIGELFHCFAGTSTGGILACGLANDKPRTAKQLLMLYLGPRRFEIFKKNRLYPFSWLFTAKYSPEGLEKILDEELSDVRLSNCGNNDLIIPVEICRGGSALFINTKESVKYSNGKLFEQSGLWFYDKNEPNPFIHRHTCDIPLKDVARCTSAAAPLFPGKKLEIKKLSYKFYDGGYKHNQPDSIALKWAMQVRGKKDDLKNVLLLSIGNSDVASKPITRIDNLFFLIYNALSTAESIEENNTTEVCQAIFGGAGVPEQYIRITPNITAGPALDDIDPANLQLLWEAAWDTIKKMDRKGEFNWLCDELLKRSRDTSGVKDDRPSEEISNFPRRCMSDPSLNDDNIFRGIRDFETLHEKVSPELHKHIRRRSNDRQPEEISYYPSRYKLHSGLYEDLNKLCRQNHDLDTLHEHLSPMLHGLFQRIRGSSEDPLQCPGCCKNNSNLPYPVSIAAGIGHITSILHYFEYKKHYMGRVLNLAKKTQKDVQRSKPECHCYWSTLHYAAANGEILAALDILYNEPLESANLTSATQENVLWRMKERLEKKTTGPPKNYTPSELAHKTGHSLMEDQLLKEYSRINDDLDKCRKRNPIDLSHWVQQAKENVEEKTGKCRKEK